MAARLTFGPTEFVSPPPPPPSDVEFRDRAACRYADPAEFDAGKSPNPPRRAIIAAWETCSWCPVISECKTWADRVAQPGVAAGEWRLRENPHATTVHIVELLTPAMRERYDALTAKKTDA